MLAKFKHMHCMAKLAIAVGALTMLCFYITALFALLIAPYADYANAMTVFRGCLEAAPASLASGVCAGLLGDLMLRKMGRGDDPE